MAVTVADHNTQITHLGFIVDGNRRWATDQGREPQFGHKQGAEQLKKLAFHVNKLKIPYTSAYIFSTENWKRPKVEVDFLMNLTIKLVERDLEELFEKGTRLVHVGSRGDIPEKVLAAIDRAVEKTAENKVNTLGLCFNYGGHQELVDATKSIIESGVAAEDVTEQLIAENLYRPELPPLDMVVRTSGEQRLSNFMLWRASYAELYFTDTYWPDFDEAGLDRALAWYDQRQRRFGGN